MTLAETHAGDQVEITKINGGGAIQQRLLDMGVTRGATLSVERYAPLKDPMHISIKGYSLALRVAEAQMIEVVKIK